MARHSAMQGDCTRRMRTYGHQHEHELFKGDQPWRWDGGVDICAFSDQEIWDVSIIKSVSHKTIFPSWKAWRANCEVGNGCDDI